MLSGIIIYYPHGLGDCILLTPTINVLRKQYKQIVVIIQERFASGNVESIFGNDVCIKYCKDVWQNGNFKEDSRKFKTFSDRIGFDYVDIWHPQDQHKIIYNMQSCNIGGIYNTTVNITSKDKYIADCITKTLKLKDYAFVQTHTGVSAKDFPVGFAEQYISKHTSIKQIVEIDKTFGYNEISLGVWFSLLDRASFIMVPDSLYFHAACALNKKIDIAYFAKGVSCWNRVKPLHNVRIDRLIFKLEEL